MNPLMQEEGLLESLEQEEGSKKRRSALAIPKLAFDPVKKIASLFVNRTALTVYPHQLDSRLERTLVASYLVEHLRAQDVNIYMAQEHPHLVEQLSLADLVMEITGSAPNASMRYEQFVLDVASMMYGDMFKTLYPAFDEKKKIVSKKKKISQHSPASEETSEGIFRYYLPQPVEAMIAANLVVPLVKEMEERVQSLSSVRELKQLITTTLYLSLIRERGMKEQVLNHVREISIPMYDVLLYTLLTVHRDFFQSIEHMEANGYDQ